MVTPASPLPQIGMTAGEPPPFPLLELTWQGFHRELLSCVCACVRVWSSHVSPHSASRVSCYHTGKPQLTPERVLSRRCCTSPCRCLCSCSMEKLCVRVCQQAYDCPKFCFSLFLSVVVTWNRRPTSLRYGGNTGLSSCLTAVLFAPLVIFSAWYIL